MAEPALDRNSRRAIAGESVVSRPAKSHRVFANQDDGRDLARTAVASKEDGQMSETMIDHRNLPNPRLFKQLFHTRA